MTQEEKAKAYDEALKKAKEMHKADFTDSFTKANLEDLFPTLKESEDERIRKEIVAALKQLDLEKSPVDTYNYLEWADWLEKQKEQKPAEWHPEDEQNLNVCLSYIKDEPLRSWLIGAIHVRYDKPAEWSEEDETIIEGACNALEIHGHTKLAERLKSLRPQPKQEVTNEDRDNMNHIRCILDDCYCLGRHDLSKANRDKLMALINSLDPKNNK